MVSTRMAAALAAIALVAGCGGSGDDSSASSGELTVSQAASRYAALATTANAAIGNLYTALGADPLSVADLRDAAVDADKAIDTFTDGMAQADWPNAVDDDVDAIVSSAKRLRTQIADLETVQSSDELNALGQAWITEFRSAVTDSGNAAARIRTKLGLPEPPEPPEPS